MDPATSTAAAPSINATTIESTTYNIQNAFCYSILCNHTLLCIPFKSKCAHLLQWADFPVAAPLSGFMLVRSILHLHKNASEINEMSAAFPSVISDKSVAAPRTYSLPHIVSPAWKDPRSTYGEPQTWRDKTSAGHPRSPLFFFVSKINLSTKDAEHESPPLHLSQKLY